MKTGHAKLVAVLLVLSLAVGCGGDGPANDPGPPPDAGVTPLGTLKAFYYYRDRGQFEELVEIAAMGAVPNGYSDDSNILPRKQRECREIVVDHEWEREDASNIYYRTWHSAQGQEKGGRPSKAFFVKRGEEWKMDMQKSFMENMTQTKGKTPAGFWNGTKRWWKD